MVDPWSSMDSSNSPLTDSGPSASEDCTPSTASETARGLLDASSPLSHDARRLPDQKDKSKILPKHIPPKTTDRAPSRDLTLELETLGTDPLLRRPHFLDEDYQASSKSNIECRIPKPHFLDHSPSPDEFDERSDITNPNFLDDEVDGDDNQVQKKAGALPKRPLKILSTYSNEEDRPHKTSYRSTLHYGLESAARSSERDKRASQLYRGTWPGERDGWTAHDSVSVRSFSSNGSSDGPRPSSSLENKMECVCSLISLLSLSPENNADLSGPLLDMSRSVESCIAMRQAGCIPLLVQLIHSKVPRETRDRAAKALRNIIHTQTDDKAGRREARVWRLLEQVREYCYVLEDLIEARKEGKQSIEDDATKHPIQSVAALMKLSFDEEHRHVVCQLGGLQALAALVSGDQAAHGSRTDDNTCLTMRKYAGMTLTNLTFGDGNNKSLLCSFKHFMLALVEQLESPNDDMRQVTAAVLRNLSWRADTNSKQVLREVGAVRGLTKAAMTCQKEATLKSVLSALWNLTAHCSMNKVALCSVDGALGFLVDMLSYDSPTKTLAIVENAGGIMRNVSSHIAVREDYRQILRERNCLSVLLQHLKSPSLTVVSNSCGTLWNLSARCPRDQQFLWEHGAVPMLRSLIHSKHKMIAMGSGAALKNLLNSKPGKTHIVSLDTTARNMNLPTLPTLGARKQKALEQELDENLAETCDNIEPATSPTTSNREEKNLFTATERQIAMNIERHRMTSSSPLMGTLTSQISLSHSAHLASYLSCSNTLLKGALVTRTSVGSAGSVNRSDSKDSVTSTHSDSVFERVVRTGKVPVPTPRNKDLIRSETGTDGFKASKGNKDNLLRYPSQPPIPPPRSSTEMRTNYTESGFDIDQDSCDQPIDYSRKYSETKPEPEAEKTKSEHKKYTKKESPSSFGDYQETDLDQPTDYSLRYAEHQSETGSDMSEPAGPSVHEDTIKHFATEGTPYETPAIFSTATSMSDLRLIGKDSKFKPATNVKPNPEAMTHSDEKDTCSIEDPPRPDNDRAASTPQTASVLEPSHEKRGMFDTKFSSGMISPEKPVNYCDEGTPGYFSRVSSLSSLGEPTEEDNLAKKNAMATINVEASPPEPSTSSSAKDKEGSKAVTFATEPVSVAGAESPRFVEDTPLMFSRSSSLGSLPECSQQDDQGSVVSEVSRLTSGCISPSEIPDSPGAGAPLSPRGPTARPSLSALSTPPQEAQCPGSVFEERLSRFVVEHTPAHFSAATSLSSLTIDDEPAPHKRPLKLLPRAHQQDVAHAPPPSAAPPDSEQLETCPSYKTLPNEPIKGIQTPGEVCKVYFTEGTPAILSKAGSNSNLSALSIESGAVDAIETLDAQHQAHDPHDTSDSSNLSDSGDLLEECIQKGIAKVVKNKGPLSDLSFSNPYRDQVYSSLPSYLRSSTETVRMSHESSRNGHDGATRAARTSPPPPLPPKLSHALPPPRPPVPPADQSAPACIPDARLPTKSSPLERLKPDLTRNDSLSSLSLDSFGSTDREIFEETVKAGLPSVNPRAKYITDDRIRAHSAERVVEIRRIRAPRSLDRGDRFAAQRRDFDDATSHRSSRPTDRAVLDEPTFRLYCGDGHGPRARRDGPASLPGRVEDCRLFDRSASLSSLSNESFGSTDREVFERSVRIGMSRAGGNRKRGRSDDRLESRRRGRRGDALARMGGSRALLEEVIARGAGAGRTAKNALAPAAAPLAAAVGRLLVREPGSDHTHTRPRVPLAVNLGHERPDPHETVSSPSDVLLSQAATGTLRNSITMTFSSNRLDENILDASSPNDGAPLPPFRVIVDGAAESLLINDATVDSGNTTLESIDIEVTEITRSNECLAPRSANTTLESDPRDELDRSNESYADVLDGSWSDGDDSAETKHAPSKCIENQQALRLTWTDIEDTSKPFHDMSVPEDTSKKSTDTWNDNTCPDDVTFPTISGSVHMILSMKSEIADHGTTLPDLLEKSEAPTMSFSRPDLTNRLDRENSKSPQLPVIETNNFDDGLMLDSISEPTLTSIGDDGEQKFDSLMSAAIEKEAARLAAQLKNSQYAMEISVTSLTSLDLDNVKPPSNLGSLLSLSASGQWDEFSQLSKKSQKSRKKSLPVALMVKRALSNSIHQGSSEHLDSNPVSFLDNVKPPSEMDHIDMESSTVSVSSIVSEVVEVRERTPIVFDFKQPVQDFPLCSTFNTVFHDLDKVNPPSLFDEIAESTMEIAPSTAQQVCDDCASNTLHLVTDIPLGSENCTPLPSDVSSVESTPKKQRDPNYLTPKEKRHVSKDRYQTYTITDTGAENNELNPLEAEQEFMTWTKSESDRSDDYITDASEVKSRKKTSAKQRRLEDRARYQTQTVNIHNILPLKKPQKAVDSHIESLKERLAAKKSIKQKRLEDAERFRTRTLSEDIPPSPTFVTKDANFENVETTTGYDSLSSNELNHQQILDDRHEDDVFSRNVDSGDNEDDFELNSPQMQTYTKSFRNYLPVIESPAAVDMCVVNNLKNIEMTASYRRTMQMQNDKNQNPSSSDFASYEGDSNSEDKAQSESETETARPKPKIIKPTRREDSLDSNDSLDKEQVSPKAIRGRKKAIYVSPYRRNAAAPKKPTTTQTKTPPKSAMMKPIQVKAHTSTKMSKPPFSKTPSANTSSKKSLSRSPTKAQQKPISISPAASKPLPLERQGTFTKEESSIPAKNLPVLEKKPTASRLTNTTPIKSNTSPSRLPQYSRFRPPVAKTNHQKPSTKVTKKTEQVMKNSPSTNSLQSNESGKTIIITSKTSRQGSTSSVNSVQSSKVNAKDVESKIANLWKKVEQAKKLPMKSEKKVWIEADKTEPPRLIRSSTFEGQPKDQVSTATKQKSAIGIRVSQIPSLRPKTTPTKAASQVNSSKKPNTRVFARKSLNGQITS